MASATSAGLGPDNVNTTGDISKASPATNGSAGTSSSLQNAKDTAINTASTTLNSIQNSQAVQDLKNGPVGQNVSEQANKTQSEFKDLYDSRTVPDQTAATGQPLTQYHSMFWRVLSWQNPRATSIMFASTLGLIFIGRYVDLLRYTFKFAYFTLGVTASLEIAGKMLFDDGLASKMRPRKYWTISRDSLERSLDDVEQLLNFFVIESQRILYAENVYATLGAFSAAFLSYWLIKLVPFWGLCLVSTCILYLSPLVYIKNRETIDQGLEQVGGMVSAQAHQIKDITAQHTGKATESLRSYAGEYSAKAQEYMGQAKTSVQNATSGTSQTGTSPPASSSNFPAVPKEEPVGVSGTTPVPVAEAAQ